MLLLDAGVSGWVPEAMSSRWRPESSLESESEESESNERLDNKSEPEVVECVLESVSAWLLVSAWRR